MRAAIVSGGSESTKMLAKSMRKHFDAVDEIDVREVEVRLSDPAGIFVGEEEMGSYDCVYLKGSYKYAQLLHAMAVALNGKCYLPVKPQAFISAHDKIYTQVDLQTSKVPMPATYLSATIPTARRILKGVNYPIIMKFPQGTQGKGVMYADSYASASSILDALDTLRQPFLIQEYVDTSGVDIRVIVAGERIVAAMKRRAEIGEMRANLHAGGIGEAFLPDNYVKKIALQASKAIGADVCAVDLLEGVKGPTVIEVNISPGLQGITEIVGSDVAERIAKFLAEQTKARREEGSAKDAKRLVEDAGMAEGQDIITTVQTRGERILLPEYVSKITRLKEDEEVTITSKRGEVTIRRFS